MLRACIDVKGLDAIVDGRIFLVVNGLGNDDIDTTDQIDYLDKAIEVDFHVVVDGVAEQFADGFLDQRTAAARILAALTDGIGGVDLAAVIEAGDRDKHVTRHGDHADLARLEAQWSER